MGAVSTLAVNLIARTSIFERGMSRSRKKLSFLQKQALQTKKAVGGMFTNMRRGALAMLAGGGAIFALKKLVDVASENIETINKFKAVFKSLSKSSAIWAKKFAKDSGRATQDVMKWMATLQDTFVPLGIARGKSAELSKELVKLAVDVASFSNVLDETAISDFTGALVGQSKAVQKYGIITNVGALKQEMFRQGITKSFLALTEQEKVLLRYNVILRSTKDAQGDVLRTSKDWANQNKRLASNITTIKELYGSKFIAKFNDDLIRLNSTMEKVNRRQVDSTLNIAAGVVQYGALAFAVGGAVKILDKLVGLKVAAATEGMTFATLRFAHALPVLAVAGGTLATGLTILIDRMNAAEAAAIRNSAKAFETRGRLFLERMEKQREKARKLAKELEMQNRQPLGKTLRTQFAEGGGRERAAAAFKEEKRLERLAELQDIAKSKIESLLTPTEKFRKEIKLLNEMFHAEVLTLDQFIRGVIEAKRAILAMTSATTSATSDFGVLTSPDVSIKGLSIGGGGAFDKVKEGGEAFDKVNNGVKNIAKRAAEVYRDISSRALNQLYNAGGGELFNKWFADIERRVEMSSPDVSIKGLSIGGGDSGIQSELKRQTTLLTVIAAKEGLE